MVEEILGEVNRMPPELVSWTPAADVWSVLENLCHIDEFVPPWTGEALKVVRDPTRTWGRDHTDTRRLAAVEAASTRTLPDVETKLAVEAARLEVRERRRRFHSGRLPLV